MRWGRCEVGGELVGVTGQLFFYPVNNIGGVIFRPSCSLMVVTPASVMPQGMKAPKGSVGLLQLIEKPCMVVFFATRMPIAAIFYLAPGRRRLAPRPLNAPRLAGR